MFIHYLKSYTHFLTNFVDNFNVTTKRQSLTHQLILESPYKKMLNKQKKFHFPK